MFIRLDGNTQTPSWTIYNTPECYLLHPMGKFTKSLANCYDCELIGVATYFHHPSCRRGDRTMRTHRYCFQNVIKLAKSLNSMLYIGMRFFCAVNIETSRHDDRSDRRQLSVNLILIRLP